MPSHTIKQSLQANGTLASIPVYVAFTTSTTNGVTSMSLRMEARVRSEVGGWRLYSLGELTGPNTVHGDCQKGSHRLAHVLQSMALAVAFFSSPLLHPGTSNLPSPQTRAERRPAGIHHDPVAIGTHARAQRAVWPELGPHHCRDATVR